MINTCLFQVNRKHEYSQLLNQGQGYGSTDKNTATGIRSALS